MRDGNVPDDHPAKGTSKRGATGLPDSSHQPAYPRSSGRRAARSRRPLLVALACLLASPLAFAGDTGAVPAQWIAKQYTELLGRAPDTTEWRDAVSRYQQKGPRGASCDADLLRALTKDLLLERPFNQLYPQETRLDRAVRATALIRAVYSREPVEADWQRLRLAEYVAGDAAFRDVAYSVFARSEFRDEIVSEACADEAGYGFDHGSAQDLRARVGRGDSRTREALQAELKAAAPAGTVTLAPGEVIRLAEYGAEKAQALVVPSGVTLTTASAPRTYARMGRIVAGGAEKICMAGRCGNKGLVILKPGATLSHVWVDGQATGPAGHRPANVEARGSRASAPTSISGNRLSGPLAGGAAVRVRGFGTMGKLCRNQRITANLITGYATRSRFDGLGEPLWTSGIAVFCGDATVSGNHLVDVSDYGILLHGIRNRNQDVDLLPDTGFEAKRPGGGPAVSVELIDGVSGNDFETQRSRGVVQASRVSNNRILSAGLDAHVALGAAPTGECMAYRSFRPIPCLDVIEERDFRGAKIAGNTFWTGSATHFDVGLLAGGGPRWGDHASRGRGLAVIGNDTGRANARVNMGVSVLGMYETMLNRNRAEFRLVDGNPATDWAKCPQVKIGVGSAEADSMPSVPRTAVDHGGEAHDCLLGAPPPDGLERLVVSDDTDRFVGADSGRTFVPWGYNYGRQISTWWDEDWDRLVNRLRTMRKMGVNTVNVGWQLRNFIDAPSPGHPDGTPKEAEFERMDAFVELAEQVGIHVVMTGAGIKPHWDGHHTSGNDGDWYSNRSEDGRWETQELFWSNLAAAVGGSGAVAWVDLMNEPIVPKTARDSWCFGGTERFGLCFVQHVTRDRGERSVREVSGAWMARMTHAIRNAGTDEPLISLGLLHCGGAFHRDHIKRYLDFASIHKYPSKTNMDDYVRLVKNCKPDNGPVVVQETYTMPGDGQVVESFIDRTRPEAQGWIGQWLYPRTPAEIVAGRKELKEEMRNGEVEDGHAAFVQLIKWAIQMQYHRMFLRVSADVRPNGVGITQP